MTVPIPFIPRYSFFHHYSPIFLENPFAPIALYHYHFCSSYTHFPIPFHFVRFPSTIYFLLFPFYLRLFFRFAHSSPCLPSPQLLFLDLSLFFSIRVTFPFGPFSAPSFCVRNFILLHQLNIADPPPLLIPEPPTSRPARSRREKNRINSRLSQDPPK